MSLVVCGIRPSVHAAYQASAEEIGVSVTSVYNKISWQSQTSVLNWLERQLVLWRLQFDISRQLYPIVRHATLVKILDGNAIAATEHRMNGTAPDR